QVVGVYNRDLVEPICEVLKNLGLKKALVVHGADGLDEITTTDKTFIAEILDGNIVTYDIDPEEVGIKRAHDKDLLGGELDVNVKIVNDILDGKLGPKRDIVVLNAAYALYAAEEVSSIEDGIVKAEESIDTGAARRKLEELKEFTHREF
ncbi:MAG: anthranilate phosphoribosyltransferase, partial [Candidatus Omnitrophota bacterium]